MSVWSRLFNTECSTCEVLKEQLRFERERAQASDILITQVGTEQKRVRELTDHILHPVQPASVPESETPQPLLPKRVPWAVTQRQLELADRHKASEVLKEESAASDKLKADKVQEIGELEAEMGVNNG